MEKIKYNGFELIRIFPEDLQSYSTDQMEAAFRERLTVLEKLVSIDCSELLFDLLEILKETQKRTKNESDDFKIIIGQKYTDQAGNIFQVCNKKINSRFKEVYQLVPTFTPKKSMKTKWVHKSFIIKALKLTYQPS